MNILNLLLLIWLLVLTVMVIFSYRTRIIYIKKIKNKRDTRAKRYVIFDIISEDNFEIREIEEAVRNSVKELGGKIWLDLSNPKVIMIYNNRGIISTNRIGYKIIIASLPLIKKIKNKEVLLVPRRTTGSLKRAKRLIGIE
ncbi:ribonuclease P [Sulfurisphaera ohwakuensis]|uniref:Ribonuclease P protein component 2 n=1 Tax=Sulfurisphaera ohwakuensis TaxID=69656 RepID=A0A650CE37_SULOH|nr:Rpp14/Pop5 family protein [Sulfurisphaera ohwakuensis]QGR16101.1 ribonuclease P [Sulfurisphaera ohwakuensis]